MVVVDGFTRHRGGPVYGCCNGFTRHRGGPVMDYGCCTPMVYKT